MIPRLDRRIELQSAAESTDDAGAPVVTYAKVESVWCSHAHASGREFRSSGQLMAETTDVFTLRWRTDITVKHRLAFEGRDFDILDVGEGEGRRQWTVLQCKARAT